MKIVIFGKGRIGKAVKYYLKKLNLNIKVGFLNKDDDVKNCDLIISTLPGDMGELGLKLALKFKKDLIDISDLEHSFYLKNKKKIKEKGILVIPFAGFSPGLVNFICGREVKENKVKEVEILTGSLSKQKYSFPFLWCFDDLIEGHQLKATLIKNGKKIKVSSFSDYRKEKIEKIDAESYLAEGLCSLVDTLKVKNMSYRVVRNFGFSDFFKYLEGYGFLNEKNIDFTKKILESRKQDNLTLGEIRIKTAKKQILWKMKTFSKKNEKLNSMQKITAIFPVALARELFKGNISKKGLIFPEQLGGDKSLFKEILKELKKKSL
jgi:saccharopine dehydrogenase-like NADP-dependent oxidoreductase